MLYKNNALTKEAPNTKKDFKFLDNMKPERFDKAFRILHNFSAYEPNKKFDFLERYNSNFDYNFFYNRKCGKGFDKSTNTFSQEFFDELFYEYIKGIIVEISL